ncbi:UDP-arabinose 4-epimerase [Azospirillum sp. OGB3]|uniref:UDP-glucose 4-epimerase GalE n=1 Tax=Azospirillum sp. OGB3 TaxID=2587012 RepID=UPI00160623CF|nr:UDP-glucose 4-epimerase GalE [Azospirillum sp. OGB3]MBB3268227.1 UDP-arabinose 4-epimerase [Azospirillum sp. OGB3]
MTAVLVTGGAGYVGSHACKALAAAGFLPVTFDSLEHGRRDAVRWGPLLQGDLADRAALDRAFAEHQPVAVLHFAAYAYVGESVAKPLRYYRNNVAGTLTLLEAMAAAEVGMLVFSSTCATYGAPRVTPIPEDHPQQPVNPYGASKLMVERMIMDVGAASGLRAVILRYFNAAGADPEGEIGENHDPETHLIPLALDAALGRIPHLTVNGDDYDTPDGTCVRDYIHVSDLADAHVRALRHLLDGGDSVALNLGNGQGFSIRQVADAAERVTGRRVPLTVGPRRPGDPPVLVGDARKARALLKWRPQRDDLDVQIADAWRWRQREYTVSQEAVRCRSPDGKETGAEKK